MRNVTIGAVQLQCSSKPEENLDNAEALVRSAAAIGANVILLPELFMYPYFCQERQYGHYSYATEAAENPAVLRFAELAKELGVVLPVSFYEKQGNRLFNSVAMLDADGSLLGVYRKTHIPDDHFYQEKFYFTPGDYRLSSLADRLRTYRRRNLLGPVVSGNRSRFSSGRRRNAALSNGYRQ